MYPASLLNRHEPVVVADAVPAMVPPNVTSPLTVTPLAAAVQIWFRTLNEEPKVYLMVISSAPSPSQSKVWIHVFVVPVKQSVQNNSVPSTTGPGPVGSRPAILVADMYAIWTCPLAPNTEQSAVTKRVRIRADDARGGGVDDAPEANESLREQRDPTE